MTDDDPITLADACRIFPESKLTVSTLRTEAARGRLSVFRIGRRDYTSRRLMLEMVRRCQDEDHRRDFTSMKGNSGLSEMDRSKSALAALNQTAQALRKGSLNTSATSTSRNAVAHR
jgi:hypothetical protein